MSCGEVFLGLLFNALIGCLAFLLVMLVWCMDDDETNDVKKFVYKILYATIIIASVYTSVKLWVFIDNGGLLKGTNSTDVEETEIVEDAEKDDVTLLNNDLITHNEDGTYTFNNKKYKSSDNGYFFYLVDDDANANTDVDADTITDAEVNIDIYYTKSYNAELFSDGTEYYLLISVPNGDYPYKLSNKEYLDIINGEFPESYVVAMFMNNTPDIFMDDTIISLYPVVGKG